MRHPPNGSAVLDVLEPEDGFELVDDQEGPAPDERLHKGVRFSTGSLLRAPQSLSEDLRFAREQEEALPQQRELEEQAFERETLALNGVDWSANGHTPRGDFSRFAEHLALWDTESRQTSTAKAESAWNGANRSALHWEAERATLQNGPTIDDVLSRYGE